MIVFGLADHFAMRHHKSVLSQAVARAARLPTPHLPSRAMNFHSLRFLRLHDDFLSGAVHIERPDQQGDFTPQGWVGVVLWEVAGDERRASCAP